MMRVLLALGLALLLANTAWSRSRYLSEFNSQYGTVGTKLDDCATCHITTNNRNLYGADLERALRANGSDAAVSLQSIEQDDADGDGAINILEITARTWPGDPNDVPSLPVEPETWTRVKALYR
jgi:hypothetical protein